MCSNNVCVHTYLKWHTYNVRIYTRVWYVHVHSLFSSCRVGSRERWRGRPSIWEQLSRSLKPGRRSSPCLQEALWNGEGGRGGRRVILLAPLEQESKSALPPTHILPSEAYSAHAGWIKAGMKEREKEEEALGTQGLVEVTVVLALVGCVCIWKEEGRSPLHYPAFWGLINVA